MRILLLIITLGLTLNGYTQVLVSYDKAEDADFSRYKTYRIYKLDVTTMPEFQPREEGLNHLIKAISDQMNLRGLTFTKDDPDLVINLGITISEETQTRETTIRDAPSYIGQRNYHWEAQEVVVGVYKAGTVVMDVVDQEKNEMVWQGVVRGVISEKKPEKNQKKIDKGVEKLFKKFPITPNI